MRSSKNENSIDVNRVVGYLNRAFANALYAAGGKMNEPRGSKFYEYQVDFCYLINTIQRDTGQVVKRKIQEANDLIENLETEQ